MSRYRETMAEALRKVYEDGHEDVSSSKRMCQTIIEDATQIRTKLDSMSAEDKLDTWWTNKLAKSADNLNSARDYIMNPIEEELQERTYDPIQFGPDKVAKAMAIATKSSGNYSGAVRDIEKIARNLSKVSTIARELKKQNEEVELDEGRMKTIYTMQQQGKSAAEIAKYMKLPVKTIKDILGEEEDFEEELGEQKQYQKLMLTYGKPGGQTMVYYTDYMQDLQNRAQEFRKKGFIIGKMGRSVPMNQLPKKMPMKGKEIKEEDELVEFSDAMLDKLAREFAPLKGKTISVQQANKLRMIFNKIPDRALDALRRKKIPFLSGLALSRMIQKGMPVKEQVEDEKEKKEAENKDTIIATLKDQIAMLKQKLENEKNKAVKPEPNPDTGEVPLTIGLANKLLKDKEMKKEEVIKDNVNQVQTRPDGSGNFNLIFRGKEIGYYHREGGKYIVYYDKDGDDYDQSDEVSTEAQAKKLAYNNMNEAFAVQITKKNGEKIVHGRYNNKADADKFIKWYKTGDMKDIKSIQIIVEADLTKPQIKKVHKMADELPKKDFKDRYGKEKGDAVRYATATNIVKKKLGIEESAAAREIDRTNTRRGSMDYQMYKKSAELLRKKDYKALGKHIYDAETAPREYVMGVISKKEPQTFTKLYGKQTGYYSLMKPLKMSENKEADMMFKKLSQRAQTYVNELLRSGMGTMEAIKKAKEKFNEGNMKNEEMRLRVEAIAGLKKKAEKSGMPYSILKKVYDRGMAAWKGGHRPGASQHQWAFARVNSFVTKSSGTWGGADKDLAAKVRASK